MNQPIKRIIRKVNPDEYDKLYQLMRETVHSINAKDYDDKQLEAWAPNDYDKERWRESFIKYHSFLVEENGVVLGFGDLTKDGLLYRFYVNKDHVLKGVGKLLLEHLEKTAKEMNLSRLVSEVSITAKPFFEKYGYRVINEQHVNVNGTQLLNYLMSKQLN